MHLTYKTDYSNQLHQLMISVSKHLRLLRNGQVRFQKKKLEYSLHDVGTSEKQHVVHYILRDHFSGAFYGEACSSGNLMPARDFLMRACSQKEEYLFCGLPQYISVPRTVSDEFPDLLSWIKSLGVELLDVTSGFQGGIRDVPTWEEYLRMLFALREGTQLSEVQKRAARISNHLNGERGERASKIDHWACSVGTIRLPSGETAVISEN